MRDRPHMQHTRLWLIRSFDEKMIVCPFTPLIRSNCQVPLTLGKIIINICISAFPLGSCGVILKPWLIVKSTTAYDFWWISMKLCCQNGLISSLNVKLTEHGKGFRLATLIIVWKPLGTEDLTLLWLNIMASSKPTLDNKLLTNPCPKRACHIWENNAW